MSDRFTEIYEENAKMRGQLIELRDRLAAVEQPADPNVEAVRRKLAERAAAGLVKYGTDTTRADLSTADWLAHLQQELMDGAVYAERLLAAVEQERAIPARMFPIQRGPAIPWSVIGPCDEQAKRNHSGQNLETLARRGGLDCGEAIDVLLGQPWGTAHGSGLVGEAAINRLLEIVQQRVALTSPTPAPDPETGLADEADCFGSGADQILRVVLEGDRIVISIGVETLKVAAEHMPELCDAMASLRVTDRSVFAQSVLEALKHEEEDGTTFVHEAIDKAFEYVVDQGLEGCEIDWPTEDNFDDN
jgi:hypothetical protein